MKISIRGLSVQALIGLYPEERKTRQELVFNIDLHTNINPDRVQENLDRTLDYDAVRHKIIAFVEGSSYLLLETLASDLGKLLLETEKVLAFDLEIQKPSALAPATVSLHIHKSRNEM